MSIYGHNDFNIAEGTSFVKRAFRKTAAKRTSVDEEPLTDSLFYEETKETDYTMNNGEIEENIRFESDLLRYGSEIGDIMIFNGGIGHSEISFSNFNTTKTILNSNKISKLTKDFPIIYSDEAHAFRLKKHLNLNKKYLMI